MERMNLGAEKFEVKEQVDNRTYLLYQDYNMVGVVVGFTKALDVADQLALEEYSKTKKFATISVVPVKNLSNRTLQMDSLEEDKLIKENKILRSRENTGEGTVKISCYSGVRPSLI